MSYSVATLKTMRRTAKANKRTNQNRSKGVRRAYENAFKMDDYCGRIRKKVDECISELNNGIKGISQLDSKCNTIVENSERQILSNQYDYMCGVNYLVSEINRCDNDADYYDGLIASYEKQIKEQGGIIYPWE